MPDGAPSATSASTAKAPLDAVERRRLEWRCRRGLLENDLFVERFFKRYGASLDAGQARGLQALMDLSDPDLLDLLIARTEPEGELACDEVVQVLRLMRRPT